MTTLFPIRIELRRRVGFLVNRNTKAAFLMFSPAIVCILTLFTVVRQVSAEEKKAESIIKTSKISNRTASLESKRSTPFLMLRINRNQTVA